MKRLEIAITEPVNCAPICPAPVSMPENLIAEIEDPERPGGEQCNQKVDCRQPGQLVIDCKKKKLQKTKGKKNGR